MTRPLGYSVERQDDGRIALVYAECCWTCSGSGKVATSWTVTCPNGCTFTAESLPASSSVRCKKCPGRWDSSEFKAVSVMGACWDCRSDSGRRSSETLLEVDEARALRDALTAALGEDAALRDVLDAVAEGGWASGAGTTDPAHQGPTLAAAAAAIRELHGIREDLWGVTDRVGAVLSDNGCDCDCGHDFEGHDAECERCLACRVQAALDGERDPVVPEAPAASVASEGLAKGAGSSPLACRRVGGHLAGGCGCETGTLDIYDDVPSNIADGDR